MRLAKYLAHAGVASRRSAEEIVRSGRVAVGDEVVLDPARGVSAEDRVTVDGVLLTPPAQERIVYAVNKPAGVVSTARDTHGRPTVVSLVPSSSRLYPVGRLDIDTTGLILLTDDGDLAHRLTHPRFEVDKTYRVTVSRPPVTVAALRQLRDGVELDDGRSVPAVVRRRGPEVIEITIHEGRKRQVRRMCEQVGHPVVKLERVAFGPLRLGKLAAGAHRPITGCELRALREASGLS
ncbi:MAG: pseudouridine synthase [Solirubrobacteraceae bacterium]